MKTAIPVSDISTLLIHQVDNFFGLSVEDKNLINSVLQNALQRLEKCFDPNPNNIITVRKRPTLTPFTVVSTMCFSI